MDLLGGGRGPGAARRAPPPAPRRPRAAAGARPRPPDGPARARLRPGALLLDPHHPPLRGFLPDAARQPRYVAITFFWKRLAASSSSPAPIPSSTRASTHKCISPAPRRITPRVMLSFAGGRPGGGGRLRGEPPGDFDADGGG